MAERDAVRRIADAVLYEGYILWPYRRSAMKNQRRWTFGGIHPEAYSARRGGDDPASAQAQVLLEAAPEDTLDVRLRFLHVVRRQVLRRGGAGRLEPVDELESGGERHVSWDEAMEREVAVAGLRLGEGAAGRRAAIDVSAGEEHLDLEGGAVVRSWRALHGSMEVEALALRPGLFRVGARVHNATPWDGAPREETLRQTFCSSHMVLSSPGGRFVSAADPPAELRAEAEACENVGVWPVLAGEDGERGTMLCSPIILEDHPRIAPESPGDLFDGGEIDGLLVLNILALTDEEKREMRAADPRAREILERTEALSQEQLLRLHGTFREVGIAPRP
jgi:hypothetical protein